LDGRRSVPIELLDVAGLVPGAHEGKGLGNKFLDDLRHADALIHVVDVSGTTDAEGELGCGCWLDVTMAADAVSPSRKGHERI
jgi:ribosome-binding ATPase YchF (GTP1/OBG family)